MNWLTYSTEVEICVIYNYQRERYSKIINLPTRLTKVLEMKVGNELKDRYKDIAPYIGKQIDINPDDYFLQCSTYEGKKYIKFTLQKWDV